MTRGGYTDASTERKVRRAQRGVESLARRPAPPGSDPVYPWTRRRRRTNQTIASGSLTAIDFDDDTNDFTDYFDHVVQSGQGDAIKFLQPGLYSVLARVVCGSLATPYCIDLNFYPDGNPDIYSYPFTVGQQAVDFRLAGTAAMDIRVEDNQTVVLFMVHTAGTSKTIVDGTFMEARYLGPWDSTGLDWP